MDLTTVYRESRGNRSHRLRVRTSVQRRRSIVSVNDTSVERGHPNVIPPSAPGKPFKVVFCRRKSHADIGLEYHPQFSADLIHWHDAANAPVILADDSDIEVVTVTAPEQLDGLPARFFRMGIRLEE